MVDEKVDELLVRCRREIDEGILPSCQFALAHGGELIANETYGDATADDRYAIFSCTKGIVSSAIWLLLSEGKLSISDRVADHVPEFGANGKDAITLEHVLLHVAGFPSAFLNPMDWDDRPKRLAAFAEWPLQWEPGSKYRYHATAAAWVLCELIERASGLDYRAFIRERIARPLGLERFELGVPVERQGDIRTIVRCGEPPSREEMLEVWGFDNIEVSLVTHELLLTLNDPGVRAIGIPAGGAVSTAADVALFYQALLRSELWDPAVVAECSRAHITMPDEVGVPCPRGLGVQVSGPNGLGRHLFGFGHTNSDLAFGHDGAGSMIAWADPATGLSFCYLTDGLDDHMIRQKRRMVGVASRAAACAEPR